MCSLFSDALSSLSSIFSYLTSSVIGISHCLVESSPSLILSCPPPFLGFTENPHAVSRNSNSIEYQTIIRKLKRIFPWCPSYHIHRPVLVFCHLHLAFPFPGGDVICSSLSPPIPTLFSSTFRNLPPTVFSFWPFALCPFSTESGNLEPSSPGSFPQYCRRPPQIMA